MPKTNSRSKFSSWNTEDPKVNGKSKDLAGEVDTNFMDEVDELLLEQELLSPTSAKSELKRLSNKNSGSKKDIEGRPVNGESPSKKGKRATVA